MGRERHQTPAAKDAVKQQRRHSQSEDPQPEETGATTTTERKPKQSRATTNAFASEQPESEQTHSKDYRRGETPPLDDDVTQCDVLSRGERGGEPVSH